MVVAWQTGSQRDISLLDSLALGGLFLRAQEPPPIGSFISMLWDLPSGEWRARAIVRRISPKSGMGVEFVHMRPEDRARLVQVLKPMLNAGNPPHLA